MNIRKKSPWVVAVLLAAGVAVAGTAAARGDCAETPSAERAHKMSMMKERYAARMDQHFDALAERLALRDEQRAAWENFRASVAQGRGEHAHRDESLSAPERMQRMEQAVQARLERIRAMRVAGEQLYAALDEGQRKVFDEHGPRAHGGHGGKHQHRHGGHHG